MKIERIKKIFGVFFVGFFLIPLFTPMTIHNNLTPSRTDAYMTHRYPEWYQEKNLMTEPYTTPVSQKMRPKEPTMNLEIFNRGPMNSPWPMYSHDVHHTGLSPYGTSDNPLVEKWQFPLDDSNFYGGFIIDTDSTIYGASYYLYSIYPNGTEKWRYYLGEIESTPAIDENGVIYVGTICGMPNYLHAVLPVNSFLLC